MNDDTISFQTTCINEMMYIFLPTLKCCHMSKSYNNEEYIKEIMSYFITSMICFTIKYYSKWTKLLWQFFALIDFRYKRRKLYERIRYLLYCWNLRILFATVAEVNQMLINQHSLCAIVTWLYLAKFNFCNIKL